MAGHKPVGMCPVGGAQKGGAMKGPILAAHAEGPSLASKLISQWAVPWMAMGESLL